MSVVKSDNNIFFSLSSQELTGGFAPTGQCLGLWRQRRCEPPKIAVSWARSGHMTACL